jgi:16S rRNA (adenine1518-N6/adenine1519-N6)-dimethyltransferase
VVLEPRPRCEPACNVITLGRVTAAAFGQRRKMLRQSLRLLGRDTSALLAAAGVAADQRAEQLWPEDFARIAAAVDTGVGA